MSPRLNGKVIYVTGAASGIGLACVRRFAEEGAVVVGADLNETDAWAEATRAAPAADFHVMDVRDEAAQQAVAADILARHGRIDALVTRHRIFVIGGGEVALDHGHGCHVLDAVVAVGRVIQRA